MKMLRGSGGGGGGESGKVKDRTKGLITLAGLAHFAEIPAPYSTLS